MPQTFLLNSFHPQNYNLIPMTPYIGNSTFSGFEINTCPLAYRNRFGQVIFRLNLPDGQANKKQRIKQHQTRLFKDAILLRFRYNKIKVEKAVAGFILALCNQHNERFV